MTVKELRVQLMALPQDATANIQWRKDGLAHSREITSIREFLDGRTGGFNVYLRGDDFDA
jgi:hypothetical protein